MKNTCSSQRLCTALLLSVSLIAGCNGIGLRTHNRESIQTILSSPEYRLPSQSLTKLDASGHPLSTKAEVWSMVRDNNSGLIWEVKTEGHGRHYWKQKYDWQAAQTDFIAQLNHEKFGGADDWRLPTVRELVSITDKTRFLPAIDTDYFPLTQTHDYWSAILDAGDAFNAWRVHFCRGYVSNMARSNEYFVRAVRGPSLAGPDLVDNGGGTITDRTTGLMWQKNARQSMSWPEAIDYCERLKLGEHSDWRLPHAHELQTLIDYARSNPAADGIVLGIKPLKGEKPGNDADPLQQYVPDQRLGFWSSTVYASNLKAAWVVDFKTGAFWHDPRTKKYAIRAVRSIVEETAPAGNSALKAAE